MSRLRQFKVREDGEQMQIEVGATDSEPSVTITLSENDALTLYNKLEQSVLVQRANRAHKSATPKAFSPLRDSVLVTTLELQIMSDGSAIFLIRGRDGRELQLSFHPDHVKVFRQAFGTVGH